MADESTPSRPTGPEPASDAKKHAGKLVVLSSIAKVPPLNEEESLLGEPAPGTAPVAGAPPAKPGEEGLIRAVGWTTRPGGTTTIIKLPPKTGVLPRLTSLSNKGAPPPVTVPPQKELVSSGEDENRRPAPIKLNPATLLAPAESESLFVPAATPTTAPVESPKPVASRTPPPPLPLTIKPHEPLLHAPKLVAHDSPAPLSEVDLKATAPLRPQASIKSETPLRPTETVPGSVAPGDQPTQRLGPATSTPIQPAVVETKRLENERRTMSLPPRVRARAKAGAPPAPEPVEKPAAVATPPKTFPASAPTGPLPTTEAPAPAKTVRAIKATITPPTIPLRPAAGAVALAAAVDTQASTPVAKASVVTPAPAKSLTGPAASTSAISPILPAAGKADAELATAKTSPLSVGEKKPSVPSTRAERRRRRAIMGIIAFYVLFVALLPSLYYAALYFSQETRLEGQVIPPPGMVLGNEVWIVTDFRDLASGISSDLSSDRAIILQDMQEKLGHVQRAQADVGAREARIRMLNDQIKALNDQQFALVKQARNASQQVWDGPGAALEADYQNKLAALNQAIAQRARANHLQYDPDPNYFSPEVWANAYRLALYQVPAGVDAVKERLWLDQQIKNWRDFTKSMDQRQNELREQAAQIKLSPSSKVADLKQQTDDLQSRVDGTIAEEEPLKAELQQAEADLAAVQAKEAGLDAKPMEKLDALPEQNVTKRLPLQSNGRFSWREVEKESKYDEGETSHVYWIFARAYRPDGRQYWLLHRATVPKDATVELMIEPGSFESTRAILRPDLPPDEQAE